MPQQDRVVFHVDCNAFYASVEEILHPELKQVPMAVCGDPKSRRGIVLAKNELAKGYGIKTAETIWQARRKCPQLTLAPARHPLYRQYSERVNAIYDGYTDQVERFGIDESYLDVTGSLHLFGGDAVAVAHEIRERVAWETGLTVSVGVSFNKIFAKLASDMKKPNAVSVISRENFRDIVWPMPVGALLFVGSATEENLRRLCIRTIGDLANAEAELLEQRLGKLGGQLHLYANGQDESPVLRGREVPEVQSIGNNITFRRNLESKEDLRTAITFLSDNVASRLRRSGVKCSSVQVTIKDPDLKVITRQKPTPAPTWLATDLAKAAMELVEASWSEGAPIRMLTVTGQKLGPPEAEVQQLSLFQEEAPEEDERRERLEKTLDGIRNKFGAGSIAPGSVVHNDLGLGGGAHGGEE